MRTKHAREIRQAIADARRRRYPSYFTPTNQGYARASAYPLYWAAWKRTAAKMPPPIPPKARSGVSL